MSPGVLSAAVFMLCLTFSAHAENGETEGASSTFGISSVLGFFKSKGTEKKLISDIKTGPYETSSLALGGEKDLAQNSERGGVLVPSKDLEAYLAAIRTKLIAASGVTQVPGTTKLRATPDLEASATPDGNIFISMAWLLKAESEDEIAAVIAHELSHILLHHFGSDILANMQDRLNSMGELGIKLKMTVEQSGAIGANDKKTLQKLQLLKELADKLVLPAWGRGQEREADLLGMDLLAKAGYSPSAMTAMLDRVRAWETKHQETEDEFQARLAALAQKNIGDAVGAVLDKAMGTLSSKHPPTSERLDNSAAYIGTFYEEEDGRPLDKKRWADVAKRRSVDETLDHYDRAFASDLAMKKNDLKRAYEKAKEAASGSTKDHAYPNWALGKVLYAQGDVKGARKAYEKALHAGDPVKGLYDDIIDMEEREGRIDNAINWVDKAQRKFGDSPTWYPRKITLLRKAKRQGDATALTMECTLAAPGMRMSCQSANSAPM